MVQATKVPFQGMGPEEPANRKLTREQMGTCSFLGRKLQGVEETNWSPLRLLTKKKQLAKNITKLLK